MTRGALVGLIHQRSLNSSSSSYDDGSAVTLMSTDVDSLDSVAEIIHETWAQFLEVIVGTTLLARQIGWTCLVPLLIIFRKGLNLSDAKEEKLICDSMLSNERLCSETFADQAKRLECCYSKAYNHDDLTIVFCKKHQNARYGESNCIQAARSP